MKCKKCGQDFDDVLLKCPNCGNQPFDKLDDSIVPKELSHYTKRELYQRIRAQNKVKKYIIPGSILIALFGIFMLHNLIYKGNKEPSHAPNIRSGLELSTLNAIGNTSGNLTNGGIASSSSNYLYTVNEQYKLVKIEAGFGGYEVLSHNKVKDINVVGDYVYYINQTDEMIYRTNVNTKEQKRLNNHTTKTMQVVGDWVYYIDENDNNSIYTMKVDGSNKKKISSKDSTSMDIYGDWIYYNVKDIGIYKLPLRGGEQELFFESPIVINNMIIIDDLIYFLNDEGRIVRTSFQELDAFEFLTDGGNKNLIISDSRLYYINQDEILCQSSLDGENEKMLSNNKSNQFNVVGDWIIYFNTDKNLFHKLSKYEAIDTPLLEKNAVNKTVFKNNSSARYTS